MRAMSLSIGLCCLGLACAGCDSTDPEESLSTTGMVIANQGNFGDGNGSVMLLDVETGNVTTLAAGFGSIVQSIELQGGSVHVVANSAGRVDIRDLETGDLTGQVTGLSSPRYMVTLNPNTAYVTNIFDQGFTGGHVNILDLTLGSIVKTLDVGENPEGLVAVGGQVYVANHGFGAGQTLSVINTVAEEVSRIIDVECDGPRTLLVDREVELWVLCTGQTLFDDQFNVIGETPGEIVLLDGTTGTEVTRFVLTSRIATAGPGQDAFYSDEEQELYVVLDQDKVLRINTGANTIVDTFGPFDGAPIGAVAYDADSDLLYLGRVPGFSANGTITVHDRAGVQVDTHPAGVAPSYLALIREEG